MLNRLQAFLEVAKTKNITKAAENLYTSQPSISMKIKALESQVGAELFSRTNKMMLLTEEGKLFFSYAERIYNLYGEATAAINEFKGIEGGKLSVSTTVYYGAYFLPYVLGNFKSKYPKNKIQIKATNTESVINNIVVSDHELGFISQIDLVYRYPNIVCKPLLLDELIFVCSPTHPCTEWDEIDLHSITDETFIISDPTSALRRLIESTFQKQNIEFNDYIILNGVEPMKRSVENNLGISILPRLSVMREIELGLIKTVPIKNMTLSREIFYIYRSDKVLSRSAEEFLKMSITHLSKKNYYDLPPLVNKNRSFNKVN
jgi:DNA-binding transcriptional LysR family regulator